MIRFLEWFKANNTYITWWLIGWLTFASIDAFSRNNYTFAMLDLLIAYANYFMWKRNQ
jgi:hypothetical protein